MEVYVHKSTQKKKSPPKIWGDLLIMCEEEQEGVHVRNYPRNRFHVRCSVGLTDRESQCTHLMPRIRLGLTQEIQIKEHIPLGSLTLALMPNHLVCDCFESAFLAE